MIKEATWIRLESICYHSEVRVKRSQLLHKQITRSGLFLWSQYSEAALSDQFRLHRKFLSASFYPFCLYHVVI